MDLLTPSLQSLLITINYSAIANLPTSQTTRTRSVLVLRCTPSILILLPLSFTRILLQLLNSQFQFSDLSSYRLLLYNLGSDSMENTVFSCRVLFWYLATSFSTVHTKHSSYCCRGVLPRSCLANKLGADHIENTFHSCRIVIAACLLVRYRTTDVLLLRA
jgi:hypothetical protein